MHEKITLLLTGTINTNNKHFTAINDKETRKKQYQETISYFLENYNFPMVFVENSGEDLSSFFTNEISAKRLEILTFNGNDYAADLGKGIGEMNCMEFALDNSKFITPASFIFKITGRYKILNLQKYISSVLKDPTIELTTDLTKNFTYCTSWVFGFKYFFAKEYLFKNKHLLNDSKGYYFEHALARSVLQAISNGVKFEIFKHYPRMDAISGSTGLRYKKSFFYYFPRQIKYKLQYFIANY